VDKNSPGPVFVKLRDVDGMRFGQRGGKDIEGFLEDLFPHAQLAICTRGSCFTWSLPNVNPMDFARIFTGK